MGCVIDFFASLCFRDVHREMGLSLSRSLESTKHHRDPCLVFEFCLKVELMNQLLECFLAVAIMLLDGRMGNPWILKSISPRQLSLHILASELVGSWRP